MKRELIKKTIFELILIALIVLMTIVAFISSTGYGLSPSYQFNPGGLEARAGRTLFRFLLALFTGMLTVCFLPGRYDKTKAVFWFYIAMGIVTGVLTVLVQARVIHIGKIISAWDRYGTIQSYMLFFANFVNAIRCRLQKDI